MTPSVLDFTDLSMCANKVRQPGYWHSAPFAFDSKRFGIAVTWVPDRSTVDCKYDRKQIDPACAAANCPRIGGEG